LKKLPEEKRLFLPMFREFLAHIGTKNYKYDKFNQQLLSCTNGVKVDIDTYNNSADHDDIYQRNEQLLISTGFLDRNIDKAFECLTELLATPNFDEPSNIADLIKMESITKANNIGNNGLSYARSYAASGLKAHARSFETLRRDIFFCQYAAEVLKTTEALPMLKSAIENMTEIASLLFREENLEIAIHGNPAKYPLIKLKLEMLFNAMSNSNSHYQEKHSPIMQLSDFNDGQVFYQNFFKTPLSVNMCAEAMCGPTIYNEEDYAAMLIL
jgi:Zn-dependent M16 (insulinase) family peptidase